MSCLPVNIASLKTLMFENCTGLTEQHLIDGMLFGEKKVGFYMYIMTFVFSHA